MARIELHPDFKDFLRLLNSHGVEYLVVGGYAVGYHGYPRATGGMDIWIAISESNAQKATLVLRDFGIGEEGVSEEMFLEKDKVVGLEKFQMGLSRSLGRGMLSSEMVPYGKSRTIDRFPGQDGAHSLNFGHGSSSLNFLVHLQIR